MTRRRPFAHANWKMAMTRARTRAYVPVLQHVAGDALRAVDVVLCPPYTGLATAAETVAGTSIGIGGQDLCALDGPSQTGAISAELLADAGCGWVMAGHAEVRRRTKESDPATRRKVARAVRAGLRPILLLGETAPSRDARATLRRRLRLFLSDLTAGEVARAVVIYEPEWAIGQDAPAETDRIDGAVRALRREVARRHGEDAAGALRIIYGGSVQPESAGRLLTACPELDGLGAGRAGRDPVAFARIVRALAKARPL